MIQMERWGSITKGNCLTWGMHDLSQCHTRATHTQKHLKTQKIRFLYKHLKYLHQTLFGGKLVTLMKLNKRIPTSWQVNDICWFFSFSVLCPEIRLFNDRYPLSSWKKNYSLWNICQESTPQQKKKFYLIVSYPKLPVFRCRMTVHFSLKT